MQRALIRDYWKQEYTVAQIMEWLNCGPQEVWFSVNNGAGDKLDEDEKYLIGKLGDIVNIDNPPPWANEHVGPAIKPENFEMQEVDLKLQDDYMTDNEDTIGEEIDHNYIRASLPPGIHLEQEQYPPQYAPLTEGIESAYNNSHDHVSSVSSSSTSRSSVTMVQQQSISTSLHLSPVAGPSHLVAHSTVDTQHLLKQVSPLPPPVLGPSNPSIINIPRSSTFAGPVAPSATENPPPGP
ncbi:hypothetical protein AcW1_001040 [Taiwanofungus camphoratus]|nr:hypothetical protein AcW1_001040 [Antrodia cinnamomea]